MGRSVKFQGHNHQSNKKYCSNHRKEKRPIHKFDNVQSLINFDKNDYTRFMEKKCKTI